MDFQPTGDLDRGQLPLGVELDRGHRGLDLGGQLDQQGLQRLCPAAGLLGAHPRLPEDGREAGDGAQRFLGGARGFLGRAGDLLERPAQLFGGGGGLSDAAGQLLARRHDALGRRHALRPRRARFPDLGHGSRLRLRNGSGTTPCECRPLYQRHELPPKLSPATDDWPALA